MVDALVLNTAFRFFQLFFAVGQFVVVWVLFPEKSAFADRVRHRNLDHVTWNYTHCPYLLRRTDL